MKLLNKIKLGNNKIANKEVATKRFFNKKIISIICIVLVVVVGGGIFYKLKFSKPKTTQAKVKYTTLEKTKIETTISSSGAIKSGQGTNIYSNLEYNVASINVKVGDKVKKGDVLATIDTSELEEQIAEGQQTLDANKAKNAASLAQAQKNYDNAKYLYDNNLNTDIVNAQTNLNKAKLTLDNDTKVYEYDKVMLQNGNMSQHDVDTAGTTVDNDQKAYNQAQVAVEAAQVSAEKEIENDKTALDSAQAAANDQTSELALEDKKKKLQDAQVVATVDGTITNVNCTVGVEAAGALFVIQDLSNLIVDADVDETDINQIAVGQKAELSTDASGSEVIQGAVTIAEPVSTAASQSTSYSNSSSGSSSSSSKSSSSSSSDSTSSDVTFKVEIQLSGQSDKVKVGMNSTIKIITNEKDDVYSVPYGAVVTQKGQNFVYAAVKQGNQYVVKEIPVTKGLESDTNVAIDGADLSDGMIILSEPASYTVGSTVIISK
ncbi:efflux RND transporter periplasmic adaptor subunit [uncultured Clostridium sp.]|uniref:efflux RND transporter periplasmic adaptor subunit n=1 Tax=uncultured Clostridium sp. TaxID=59620 RepID=UPI0028EF2C28|nr:efflux RND transporter periplasmic adaptor subunit [uncultured Clostridium sp.]